MTFTRGDIIRHRATGQRGVVIRVESDNAYAVDYGFGCGAVVVQECVIEAVEAFAADGEQP